VLLCETICINAQSTIRLYEQLLAAHPDKARIYGICDNARYHKTMSCRLGWPTSSFAKCFYLRIHLI